MTDHGDTEAVPTAQGGLAATPSGAALRPRRRARAGGLTLGGFLGIVAGVFALASAATLALPHDPYIRYQSFQGTIFHRLSWVYERLAFDDTPIDVLVVGSSRSARGVNVPLVEAALADLGRGELRLANISEPAAGFDIRLTKIRDALELHPEIRMIVFGVVELMPRDGHQAFGDLGTPGEILSSPWLINLNLPGNLAALPYRQMEYALASALPEAFGYRAGFDPEAYLGRAPDHRLFDNPGWTEAAEAREIVTPDHAAAVAGEAARRARGIRGAYLPDWLGWAEFGVSRHYLRELDRLAAAHDVEIVFLHLPFHTWQGPPLDAAWLERIGPVWSADFLSGDVQNYADAAHASQKGVALVAPWIAGRIAATLEPAS